MVPRFLRPILVLGILCVVLYITFFHLPDHPLSYPIQFQPTTSPDLFRDLHLTEAQCSRTFPDLTYAVDLAIREGPFGLDFIQGAFLHAQIRDGQLVILHAPGQGQLSAAMLQRQMASLHQIHRALVTSPSPVPNTSLTLSVHDTPIPATLSYSVPALPADKNTFPIPHFSFWSWPLSFVTSIPAAAVAIAAVEDATPFAEKRSQAIWRGTAAFVNGAGPHPNLRSDLLRVTQGAGWADVQALRWSGSNAANAIPISEFCRYKYVLHTEGVAYSGRLQFHQLCRSVLITPPLDFRQHTSHLVRPVFATTLLGGGPPAVSDAWPIDYPVEEANAIFVSYDWADLEATIAWLERHQDVAEGIASRQRELFADKGYLSPAAETCYWRSVIEGWSRLAKPQGEGWDKKGTPFEEFVVVSSDL